MTQLREGVVMGMKRRRMRMKKRMRKTKKTALEAQVKRLARAAPREAPERARVTLLGRELEVETARLHWRVEKNTGEEMRWKMG